MENQVKVEAAETVKQVASEQTQVNKPKFKGKFKKSKSVDKTDIKPKFNIEDWYNRFPKHIVDIYMLLNNNAEIRRFTALGILNYLLQKGEINGDKRYCKFKVDKFIIRANGLVREYRYTETFFINALVASFTTFAASAERVINEFVKVELQSDINHCVNKDDVTTMIDNVIEQTNKETQIEVE